MTVGPIIASFARRETSPPLPNKVTRTNARGPLWLPFRALWAVRIAHFCRSAYENPHH
jgi:hypothetical protein